MPQSTKTMNGKAPLRAKVSAAIPKIIIGLKKKRDHTRISKQES